MGRSHTIVATAKTTHKNTHMNANVDPGIAAEHDVTLRRLQDNVIEVYA